ncbi:Ribosomal L18p/L5e family protein isoform 1 [Hibiscus syriacus]|uniref:RING-type E3 ubiquitin transferase n=1 Tax=Hibiscus syriacus TaxID=106335 RepID=A0A6A2ZUV3_HIBSY|nr:Ribosomal L18p/L5e family protein isoform 1 [Hibiscus syriacus]
MTTELELSSEIGNWLACTSSCCKNTLVLTTTLVFFFAVLRCMKLIIVLLNSNFNAFFTFPYRYYPTTAKVAGEGAGENVPYCCVCLYEAEEGEMLRRLPRCNHCFHVDCIDVWFQYRSTCPLCRNEVYIGLHRPHNQLLAFLLNLFRKIHH